MGDTEQWQVSSCCEMECSMGIEVWVNRLKAVYERIAYDIEKNSGNSKTEVNKIHIVEHILNKKFSVKIYFIKLWVIQPRITIIIQIS